MPGMLVVLEGIDGAGTSTQTALLAERLAAAGIAAHATREPSDGPIGRLLRQLLAGHEAPVTASTLALLFAADRMDHLAREVEPAIATGKVVLSDRWYHSSLAYQGSEEDRAWIHALNARARRPDLTFLLDVRPEVAAARRAADRRSEEIFDALATQRRVAETYRTVADQLAGRERIVVLDGERPVAELADEIFASIRRLLAAGGR